MNRRHFLARTASVGLLPVLAACQPARLTSRARHGGPVLRVNVQGSLGYASLAIVQARRLLESRVPGLTVEWKVMPSEASIVEALETDGLDIATGSPVAFLLARESGAPVRIVAGLAEIPIALVSARPGPTSIRALRSADQIAVPVLDGLAHMLVRMAALRDRGDWRSLDRQTVVRPAHEALAALVGRRDVTVQVAASPFLDRALEQPGITRLVDAADLLGGPITTVVAYTTLAKRQRAADLLDMFVDVVREAGATVARDALATARLLAQNDPTLPPAETVARAIRRPDLAFANRVRGLDRLAGFMHYTGHLARTPSRAADLVFDTVDVQELEDRRRS